MGKHDRLKNLLHIFKRHIVGRGKIDGSMDQAVIGIVMRITHFINATKVK
jgi:hypothetical protein